jgi:hypothetical protein
MHQGKLGLLIWFKYIIPHLLLLFVSFEGIQRYCHCSKKITLWSNSWFREIVNAPWFFFCRRHRWVTKSESLLLAIIIPMIYLFVYIGDSESCHGHSRRYLILQYMSAWHRPKATHIYTVSITYFVLRFCERFFKTHNITHVTGTNIYIYTRTYVQDGMEMRRNLFMDLSTHERNGYQRFLPTDIKHYLSRITEKVYKVEFVSLRRHAHRDRVNFTNFIFLD